MLELRHIFRLTWCFHQNKNSELHSQQLKLEHVFCHSRQNPPFASTTKNVSTETQNCDFTFGFGLWAVIYDIQYIKDV
jgi:hypothetical protein